MCIIIFTANIIKAVSIKNKNDTIILQPGTVAQQSITLQNIWRNVKLSPVNESYTDDTTANTLNVIINGIVVTSRAEDTYVLVSEGKNQKRYQINEALGSNPAIIIRKINRTSVIFENHGRMEKVMLTPGKASGNENPFSSDTSAVLADALIATPIREGEKIHGLRLQPKTGYAGFRNTLLQPGDVAIRLNNISLTGPDEIAEALSSLLTLQSVQFTVRRNGVPRLINVSVKDIMGKNEKNNERIQ